MASAIAIGILTDNTTIYDQAITYFKSGDGQGMINNAIWIRYDDFAAQLQEVRLSICLSLQIVRERSGTYDAGYRFAGRLRTNGL